MANKRMFSREITDSDHFLDLSIPAQALYFHLGMVADDEGLVSSAKRISRAVGTSEEALDELVRTGFLISFPDSGVYAIRHFFVNNSIRADRAKETIHRAEASQLQKGENGLYSRLSDVGQLSADCPADVPQLSADCQTDGGTDQPISGYYSSVESVKTQLAAEGWTMTDIDEILDRCRGKQITNILSYARQALKNNKAKPPVHAQDFPQRSYSDVNEELMAQTEAEVRAFLAAEAGAAG